VTREASSATKINALEDEVCSLKSANAHALKATSTTRTVETIKATSGGERDTGMEDTALCRKATVHTDFSMIKYLICRY